MRETCLNEIYKLAKHDKRIIFIGSDLGYGTLNNFKNEIPNQFFMEGISEGFIIGMASGLALEGNIVYVNTISTFLTRRAYEQIVIDACLHNLKIRLIGNGGGLVYAPLGPTHTAIEDISIMRTIPNMTIVVPSDADEMKRIIPQTVEYDGPIYIRIAKGFDPIVSSDKHSCKIGESILIKDGNTVLLITTGITLNIAIQAANELEINNISTAILHCPTIKPFDINNFINIVESIPIIITIEENTIIGGLGSLIAEVLSEKCFKVGKKFKRHGIPDKFPHRYGSQAQLMDYYSISKESVLQSVYKLINE